MKNLENQILTEINIINNKANIIDYIYKNNILHILYYENECLKLIYYDIQKYTIIYKYKFCYGMYGCFNDNILYIFLWKYNSVVYKFNIETKEYIKYKDINIPYKKTNYYMFNINNEIYLCIVNELKIPINIVPKININNDRLKLSYREIFLHTDEKIILSNVKNLITFNIINKSFSVDDVDIKEHEHYYNITKISKYISYINHKLYNYKTGEIIELNGKHSNSHGSRYFNNIISLIQHDSNNIINNIYLYHNSLYVETSGIVFMDMNSTECLTFTNIQAKTCKDEQNSNNVDIIKIPKNVLIKRSIFFKNMFNDCDENINKIEFKFYDKLNIYINYIKRALCTDNESIDYDNFDKLFEL